MKRTIRIPLVLIIIFIIAIGICIKSNASTTGTITEITVNVREKASIDSKVIMYVTQDNKVDILEKTGDWYKIKYKGKEGYVYSDFIKVKDEDVKETNNSLENDKNLENDEEEVTKTISPKLILPKDSGVRITPNITSNIIYTTTSDIEIKLLEQINNWSYIELEKIRGWIRNSDLKENTETKQEETKQEEKQEEIKEVIAYTKYGSVNLRKDPSTDSTVIERLTINTEVRVLEEVDSVWEKVSVNGNTGYISKDLLSSTKQEEQEKTENTTTSRNGELTSREESDVKKEEETENKKETSSTKSESSSSTTASQIVEYAKKYFGYKYVYGGSSPNTGFDCSGFTSYVYKHFGYTLSRSSVGQASNGVKVEKADLQPGDLVIFKNQALTKIGHVGIYIGNNKMIHASEPGVGVTITDIDSKAHKYPQRFVMGRRIIK